LASPKGIPEAEEFFQRQSDDALDPLIQIDPLALNPVHCDGGCPKVIHHRGYRALLAPAEDGAESRLRHGKASSSADEQGEPLAITEARDLYVIGRRWAKHTGNLFAVCLRIALPPAMFSGGRANNAT
jgi:hypothetical protein